MEKDVVYEPDLNEAPFTSAHTPWVQLSLIANLTAREPEKGFLTLTKRMDNLVYYQ